MLFDLITAAKVHIKIEYPNILLLFIENLCFCSLKIAVCAPKITAKSKNCRLKITIISKNYGLKIPVRVRACVRMYARAYDCHDSTSGTRRTHDQRKREEGKPAYRGIIAGTEKKYKKSLKKFGNVKKPPYLCSRNRTTNTPKGKKKKV